MPLYTTSNHEYYANATNPNHPITDDNTILIDFINGNLDPIYYIVVVLALWLFYISCCFIYFIFRVYHKIYTNKNHKDEVLNNNKKNNNNHNNDTNTKIDIVDIDPKKETNIERTATMSYARREDRYHTLSATTPITPETPITSSTKPPMLNYSHVNMHNIKEKNLERVLPILPIKIVTNYHQNNNVDTPWSYFRTSNSSNNHSLPSPPSMTPLNNGFNGIYTSSSNNDTTSVSTKNKSYSSKPDLPEIVEHFTPFTSTIHEHENRNKKRESSSSETESDESDESDDSDGTDEHDEEQDDESDEQDEKEHNEEKEEEVEIGNEHQNENEDEKEIKEEEEEKEEKQTDDDNKNKQKLENINTNKTFTTSLSCSFSLSSSTSSSNSSNSNHNTIEPTYESTLAHKSNERNNAFVVSYNVDNTDDKEENTVNKNGLTLTLNLDSMKLQKSDQTYTTMELYDRSSMGSINHSTLTFEAINSEKL